jgi:hypothetical protein
MCCVRASIGSGRSIAGSVPPNGSQRILVRIASGPTWARSWMTSRPQARRSAQGVCSVCTQIEHWHRPGNERRFGKCERNGARLGTRGNEVTPACTQYGACGERISWLTLKRMQPRGLAPRFHTCAVFHSGRRPGGLSVRSTRGQMLTHHGPREKARTSNQEGQLVSRQ